MYAGPTNTNCIKLLGRVVQFLNEVESMKCGSEHKSCFDSCVQPSVVFKFVFIKK